ncbi:hypothetical protein QUF61_06635 [Candidatus Venteria ishoeyi]|uniref:hypothetical protein n=1 Tax=Candidatus Venteria ishoeyi TaxID=1899563 RepID=UPI0025A5A389|nr:hypothetical protein [Candidatus Venteria ishoeyi]MDM8546153.1 hypothetical protein [Candidatus Venteria ishoeyi]
MADFGKWVINAFNELTPNINGIYNDAKLDNISDWRMKQQAMVTGTGAAAMAIPGAHLAALAADVAFLMNRMAVCSYGIGAIYGHDRFSKNILENEDFANVLAYWAGDEEITTMVGSKTAADIALKVGGKAGIKIIGKTIAKSGAILIGKKLGGKVGAKIGAKFAGKLAGKAAAGMVPFLGAAVGGGINLWFITGIADSAEAYYKFKCDVISNL